MTPDQYQQFTETLLHNVKADTRVLGLVLVGSTASLSHAPDQWSDHDFWLVTQPEAQEAFRTHTSWLPSSEQIVLWYRETHHAIKVVYADGHLVEAAVADLDELEVAMINDYRIVLGNAAVEAKILHQREVTTCRSDENQHRDNFWFGEMLTNLLVGVGRYARGERLSGHKRVKLSALGALMRLLSRYIHTDESQLLDNLDPLRRFEFAFPEIGAELNRLLLLDVPEAADALLQLAETHLRPHLVEYPAAAVETVRQQIASVKGN